MKYYTIFLVTRHFRKKDPLSPLLEKLVPLGVNIIFVELTVDPKTKAFELEINDNADIKRIEEEIEGHYKNSWIMETVEFTNPSAMMLYFQNRKKERDDYERKTSTG